MASFTLRMKSAPVLQLLSVTALAAVLLFSSSCGKRSCNDAAEAPAANAPVVTTAKAGLQQTLSSVVTVAGIRPIAGSSDVEVFFNENTQFFNASGEALINRVKEALETGRPLKIAYNPWQEVLVSAAWATDAGNQQAKARTIVDGRAGMRKIDLSTMTNAQLDEPSAMGVMNTTDPGLNNVIPDFATAQLMFDYICRQCCALPGPYAVDYCIPFQYCRDGCYARAHKMCWIINNRYKYGTKKIFSFANAGTDKLCVQGQKWGGCCIRWWYHVAPLVTIKTPTGPKAYVFDPAMFNQPVLLSTWLHAQENPACATSSTVAHVTMINVQPNSSYTPSGSTGYVFGTDPVYSSTNTTLINYSALTTCP